MLSNIFSFSLPLQLRIMKMFYSYIVLLFLSGGGAFFIYNTQHSLCLEDSAAMLIVTQCDLDSESQQWIWINKAMLMCVASSRCLWARPGETARTLPCGLQHPDAAGLMWDCDRNRLVSRNSSLLLAIIDQHVTLTALSKWRSLDERYICQEKLRFRRASDDADEFEFAEERTNKPAAMNEEQREFLQWYYRTEDPTTWKFVLLGAAFVCLLIGFLLLGMGSLANMSRKKIAKYKAAASLAWKGEDEELKGFPSTTSHSEVQAYHPDPGRWDGRGLKAGNIMVIAKDGNNSFLLSHHINEEEIQEAKKEELEGKQKLEDNQVQNQVTSESSLPGK